MRIYLPDHRVVKVTPEEYEVAKTIYGNRIFLVGDYGPKPYITKRIIPDDILVVFPKWRVVDSVKWFATYLVATMAFILFTVKDIV